MKQSLSNDISQQKLTIGRLSVSWSCMMPERLMIPSPEQLFIWLAKYEEQVIDRAILVTAEWVIKHPDAAQLQVVDLIKYASRVMSNIQANVNKKQQAVTRG